MSAVLLTGGQQSQVIPSQTGTVRPSVRLSFCSFVCLFVIMSVRSIFVILLTAVNTLVNFYNK